jgi:Leucine-rich repeat (LRR) protein
VENVARLVNLQILSLSGNTLDSLDSLAEIAGLSMLRQLTFRCEHFS